MNDYFNPNYIPTISLSSFVLTSIQKDVIIGTLLGDLVWNEINLLTILEYDLIKHTNPPPLV